jgi:hypothetical protein
MVDINWQLVKGASATGLARLMPEPDNWSPPRTICSYPKANRRRDLGGSEWLARISAAIDQLNLADLDWPPAK